mgnify:CR=1 FL=1
MNSVSGSSPLTRGKHSQGSDGWPHKRLIPAHAGKTLTLSRATTKATAHPRSRGENDTREVTLCAALGSSPLTRGKPTVVFQVLERCRLIPAHAGKTSCCRGATGRTWAHPRSRGENVLSGLQQASGSGSSPLTRGKRVLHGDDLALAGLIPAHAGKTGTTTVQPCTTRAHPRSRGENLKSSLLSLCRTGSSPLTRGKPIAAATALASTRLIPAHAGKTRFSLLLSVLRTAHPRSRGENTAQIGAESVDLGSSPLTRGKHAFVMRVSSIPRLIPAHAGKTRRPPRL